MNTYMITSHAKKTTIRMIEYLQWFIDNDIKKWIIGIEKSNKGETHLQIRCDTRYSLDEMIQRCSPDHVELASDNYEYEKKEGKYYASWDTVETLKARLGNLRPNQRRIIENLNTQNDRQIDVIVDTMGNTGKTFLARHLFNTGKGFYVPPTLQDGKGIIQYVASGYHGEPFIVIDVARSTRWNNALYIALETIKDGLIYDARYKTTIRDIHGVKVLVTTNTMPKIDKLSKDRWRIYDKNGDAISGGF